MLQRDSFVWALGAICQLQRVPFDLQLLLRQYPPPYRLAALLQALRDFGIKASHKRFALQQLQNIALPCLAVLKAGPEDGDTRALAMILQHEGERLLILEHGQQSPQAVSIADFARRYDGKVVLLKRQPEAFGDEVAEPGRFGFRWFIPELIKYRKIWTEILLASFAIQLVGLAVPVCTQIVIDKVVVHHTVSTLVAIAVALFIFLVFNAAMGWVRQYLVLHTGNRIDATLGHKVFSHLLDLPLRYYQHRPTGVVVARVHGVETIREFLAGGLVTLVLDFPFC